jgi:hypothetical protein
VRRLSSKCTRTKDSHPNRYIAKDYQLPLRLHWGFLLFADPTLTRRPPSAPMAPAAFFEKHSLELAENAIIKGAARHISGISRVLSLDVWLLVAA